MVTVKSEASLASTSSVLSVCYMCYNCCGIRVHKVDGWISEIDGDTSNPYNLGKLCAKGKAGMMGLYNPYRIKSPLKRTNPEKGLNVDPGWQEISWDEAMNILVEKLSRLRKEDPRKLVLAGLDFHHFITMWAFASAYGTPNIWKGAADYFCGNALHSVLYMTNGTFQAKPDLDFCNYCILIGNQLGFMVGSNAVPMTRKMAEARARGMKLIVVDPVCTAAGSKASEWVPIRPGTDGAFALAILNLLVNELGIYDADFLRRYTNAVYLVGPQGRYVRDPVSGKPLAWDLSQNKPVSFDQGDCSHFTLEGQYQAGEHSCWPAFQLLKDHVRKYTAEMVSDICSVPAETIRRIAQEFGQAVMVGSKITIRGKSLPYRPAVVNWSRGAIGHKHAMLTALAIQLINIVVGAMDVPGGQLGSNPVGPDWAPKEGPDGLLVPSPIQQIVEGAFPARRVKAPESLDLMELFPLASYAAPLFEAAVLEPDKFGLDYRPEVMLHFHSNLLMGTSNPNRMEKVLRKIPFIASFAFLMDETVQFADLVLPDTHYLERLYPFPNHVAHFVPEGLGSWHWMVAQPVVKPAAAARSWQEVLLQLADRLKLRQELYMILNQRLNFKEPYQLDPAKNYSWEEIADCWAKSWFGPERGYDWFKENGFFISGDKKVEEAYPRPFFKARIPIYYEHFIEAGEEVRKVTQELGLNWDTSDYQPLPDWKPCLAHKEEGEFDLYPVNFKLPFHTFSLTTENPWLNEIAEHNPYAYKILINTQVAEKKDIQDGDGVWIESASGKIKGQAKLTECIHPETVGIAGTFGHWGKGLTIGKEKGAHFNSLLDSELDRIDLVSTALDCCVKVKLHKQ